MLLVTEMVTIEASFRKSFRNFVSIIIYKSIMVYTTRSCWTLSMGFSEELKYFNEFTQSTHVWSIQEIWLGNFSKCKFPGLLCACKCGIKVLITNSIKKEGGENFRLGFIECYFKSWNHVSYEGLWKTYSTSGTVSWVWNKS